MSLTLGLPKERLACLLLVALLCLPRMVTAADPVWYAQRDTWVETYLATMNALCSYEREQGTALPDEKNDGKLPVFVFPRQGGPSDGIAFDVDVSGMDRIYLGCSNSSRLLDLVLVNADATEQPLCGEKDLTVPYVIVNTRGRFYNRRPHIDLQENELELELGGRYERLVGRIHSSQNTIVWLDTKSHFEQWGRSTNYRRQVQGFADRAIYKQYEERDKANAVRSQFSQIIFALPAGLHSIDIQKAARDFETAMCDKYGKQADERIVVAVKQLAASVKSEKGFERLVRLSFALSSYHNLNHRKGRSTSAADTTALIPAFASIEKDFFQLDPDKFDYGIGLKEKLEAFDETIKEYLEAPQHLQVAYDTIEYVDKVNPVSDDVWSQLAGLEKELEAAKDNLDAYMAARDKIRRLRRDVIFSHPALDFDRILINRNPPPSYSHNGDQHLGRHSRVGKGLTILSDWKSDHPKVTTPLAGKLPEGAIRNPDLHYDADRVTFAYCDHTVQSRNDRRFFLYEAALDGSWVRQITGTERDPFDTWNSRATVMIEDNDPCYLPDGDIIFISTRGQSYGRCHGGRYNPAWVLHRCNPAGDEILQLSFNNENEYEPSVLNDGRIIFTRWEYTNRHEMFFHMLWWCRPDGSSISHYYGNDTLTPMMVVEASAIPGTHKIVATAQGHHSYNTGTTVVYDTTKGENGEEPVTHITTETPYSESSGWPSPHFSHPYAINEDMFLVSRAGHRVHHQGEVPPPADRAIYLVDKLGGRELIYEDIEVASFSPIAIRKRRLPPVIPSLIPDNSPDSGTVFVQNAYLTRNDPEGLITPGIVKAIRVNAIGVQPRSSRSACSMTVPVEIPKKVLGTVPLAPDGSAYFIAPARTALQLQLLDENGMAILTEKSFFYLQPGEKRSCVGCHEPSGSSPSSGGLASTSTARPMELLPAAGPQYPGGLSFMRSVQPVLDRYCIDCHGLEKTDGDVNLVDDGQRYPISYRALVERGDHRLGLKGYKTNESSISRPFEYYAHSNKVAQMLLDEHGKVKMDHDSRMRIIEWMDLNAQCYGDLFPNKLEERRIDAAAMEELRAFVTKRLGEKLGSQPERALINVAQPDESRILMAPLAQSAGGWGQLDGFGSKNDPDYQKLTALVEACIIRRPSDNTAGWKPSLECGAGERWVMEARQRYREQFLPEPDEATEDGG